MKVAGIGLKVPVAVLITFGAVAAGLLTVAFFSSLQHAALIDKEIQRLYLDMEFKDRTLFAEIASPFRHENALTAFIGQFSLERYQDPAELETETSVTAQMWLLMTLVLIIPTAAQAGAGFKVSELLQSSDRLGGVWILFVLLAVLTACLLLIVPEPHDHFRGERRSLLSSKSGDYIVILLTSAIVALPGIGLGYIVAKVLAGLMASQ